MSSGERRREESVEFVDSDPHAFGPVAPSRPSTRTLPRRLPLTALGGVVLLVVAASALWWPRRSPSPAATPTSAITTTVVVTAPSGRVAPGVNLDPGFSLVVRPALVEPAATVTMQLSGDLDLVADRVAAVAWLDHLVNGRWRTSYWLARSPTSQQVRGASGDRAEAGPDAVMVDASTAVTFTVDGIAPGRYRMCRYVPLRPDPATNQPSSPAYVCASLVVAG